MVTPFTADGELDLERAASLASSLVDQGNDGLVVSGTTGESPTTSDREKSELLRAVVDAVGDRAHVLAGVGTNDTRHSVELAREAEKCGATGLLLVTPYYSRPPQSGLLAHTRRVAGSTDLPVLLYDIPVRTGVALTTETILSLSEHPQVVAVKDAKDDLAASTTVLAATDLAYYSGTDALNLAFLTHGAAGMVSMAGHIAGDRLAELVRAVDAGDLAAARADMVALLPAIDIICGSGNGALRSKVALELLGLIPGRTMRLPQATAQDDEVEAVRTAMRAAGLLDAH